MANASQTVQQVASGRPATWWSDILLWLLIVGVLGWTGYYFVFQKREESRQVIHLTFMDANELAKGSIVRMMGTEIGYVSDIKVFSDHVNVTLKTNPNAIRIPSGSIFTVNFTGLVGSKSIEVIPPEIPKPYIDGKPDYRAENPIRLKQALQYMIDIAQALQRGAENFTDFFGKKQPIEELQYNVRISDKAIHRANQVLADVNHTLVTTQQDTHQGLAEVDASLQDFTVASREAVASTRPSELGPNIYQILADMSATLIKGRVEMANLNFGNRIPTLNRQYHQVMGNMSLIHAHVRGDQWKTLLDQREQDLTHFDRMLLAAQQFFAQDDRLLQLQQARQSVQGFNRSLIQLEAKVQAKLNQQAAKPHGR